MKILIIEKEVIRVTYAQVAANPPRPTDMHTARALAVAKYDQQERLRKEREKLSVLPVLRLDDKGELAKEVTSVKDTDLTEYIQTTVSFIFKELQNNDDGAPEVI